MKLNLSSIPAIFFALTITKVIANPNLVVFGNSLSDIGNKVIKNTEVPFWAGGYSNGPVWSQYLAYFNNYTLINYAFGGAVSNNEYLKSATGVEITVPSTSDQINQYTETFKPIFNAISANKNQSSLNELLKDDIAVIEIGSNDIFYAFDLIIASNINTTAYIDQIVLNVIDSVQKLIDFGFQKIIVTNIPNLLQIPANKLLSGSSRNIIQDSLLRYNQNLDAEITKLALSSGLMFNMPKSYIKLFDIYSLIDVTISDISRSLEISNTFLPCYLEILGKLVLSCSNSNMYYFVDGFHPATKVHAITAAAISETLARPQADNQITAAFLLPLIEKYNVNNANSNSNFLFSQNDNPASLLKITQYNIINATASI
ncbi:hypothetical protein BB561_000132 [Smittium simulii]|uniref:SGNH hydrolase-type esterase domain-containing protein n=1 Tax=Smittium simulii TaxID=133385 RepID=A0A2T9Z0A3_9FUNG|nr:hypothetical protein BB561_000132 [Smittium simulii]